jgi:hypothetical protein
MTDRLTDLKQDVKAAIQAVKVEKDPVKVAINVRPEQGQKRLRVRLRKKRN